MGWCLVNLMVYFCALKTSVGAKFTIKFADLSVVFHRCVSAIPLLKLCEMSLSSNGSKKNHYN